MVGREELPSTPAATAAAAQSRNTPIDDHLPSRLANGAGRAGRFKLGDGVCNAAGRRTYERTKDDPIYRPLKIYTSDPSVSRLDGAAVTINIPFEPLKPGPAGAHFEVLSSPHSPFGSVKPVDLEDRSVLIANGRDPAPADPAFHHQQVYAVASSVYAAFRTALGRELGWGFSGRRLRLVPHAGEHRQAAYSREQQAILFGFYRATDDAVGRVVPGGFVFSCLSHDIIAHELTHALLDGLRARFDQSAGGEADAFHEAFADLVPMFQRFSYKEVVRSAIRRSGGRLEQDGTILSLASEFSHGIGETGGLRRLDLAEQPKVYRPGGPSHELGLVMLSAIFEAFLTVYRRKAEPYLRLFPSGVAASAELVEILSHIASRLASQFLTICIRAIDYCPVTCVEVGEYLCALITADYDLVPDDPWAYREALIDAFSRRRIYPRNVMSLSEGDLVWKSPATTLVVEELNFANLRFVGDPGTPAGATELRRQADALGRFVTDPSRLELFGLAAPDDPELNGDHVDPPCVESIRSSRRVGPDGQIVFDLIAEVIQLRRVPGAPGLPHFLFPGGSTVILGPKGEVRYIISKNIKDSERLARQRLHECMRFEFAE